MDITRSLLLLIVILAFGCQEPQTKETTTEDTQDSTEMVVKDPHSFGKPNEAMITHLMLNLKVNFEEQALEGFARYNIDNNDADQLILDVKDLNIQRVTLGETEEETTFEISEPKEYLGSALTIDITPETRVVSIYYKTDPEGAAALDWLDASQTADKKHPFLFTQGQAILTRTWIPIQDSPGIRITYNAQIEVPKELMAVMSAANPQRKTEEGIYTFEMKQPIPPYLMALAVGDLQFKAVSERTGVYAEPSMIDKAAYEFADMEKMLVAAENLYGPYLWDRYDVIVLPPSFPFGGMENPRLTFLTPTVIAGDRSLVALIAHELAHSWSGNLVTNATWDDFWLNEGFTVYFERRIMEEVYGKDYTNMLIQLGYQDLEADVEDLGGESEDTHLKLDLEGRDPDEGMTDIAYEKGAFFLSLLEEKAGRENFDQFLKQYFEEHKFQTITTEQFVKYLNKNLIEKYELEVNVEEWIYGPGIPDNIPFQPSERFQNVDMQVGKVVAGTAPSQIDTKEWTTHEWLHFIRHLPNDLDASTMTDIDEAYQFSDSGNNEILAAWYQLSIQNGYSDQILPKIEAFLVKVGRRKFLTPLYRAFKEHQQLETAREIYQKAKPNYHAVSRNSIEELLELS